MESFEAREGNLPWDVPVPGSWVAGQSLPWLETVAAGVAERESLAGDGNRGLLPAEDLDRMARAGGQQERSAGLIHDARNMVTAIELYCDLLDEPGVLADAFRHYAGELRTVSTASRRLLERLAGMGRPEEDRERGAAGPRLIYSAPQLAASAAVEERGLPLAEEPTLARRRRMQGFGGEPVVSLAEELQANQSLLSAVAGHAVTVGLEIVGCDAPVEMSREDLTRVLVNLTRNAAEAMPDGGHLQIALVQMEGVLRLSLRDTGQGIASEVAERIFLPGYTTHVSLGAEECDEDGAEGHGIGQHDVEEAGWLVPHRGLGLAIVRSLVSAAAGRVWAANREDGQGAVFTVEFPLRMRREGWDAASGFR